MDNKIAKQIKTIRLEHGYKSQQLFADALHVHLKTVQGWEREKDPKLPDLDNLLEMCSLLNCDLDYLTGRIKEPTHDIKFIREKTGLSVEAIKKLINNKQLVFGLSLIIEEKGFTDLCLTIGSVFRKRHFYNTLSKEGDDFGDEKEALLFSVYRKLANIIDAIPDDLYFKRWHENDDG